MKPTDAARASELPTLIAVEHIEGDGRIVDRVWLSYHWINGDPPIWVNVDGLERATPVAVYDRFGNRQ